MSFVITIKLLNGPMKGRSLGLPQGLFTLGQGDVDIVTTLDDGITQVDLLISNENVSIVGDVPCWVDGTPTTDNVLPLNKVIDLAGVCFVLVPQGEIIDNYQLVKRKAYNKQPWFGHKTNIIFFLSILLILLLLSVFGIYRYFSIETESDKLNRLGLQGWISEQLKNDEFKDINVVWNVDHTVTIKGSCSTEHDIQRLMRILRMYGVFYRLEAVCDDQLLQNVRYLLEQSGYKDIDVTAMESKGSVHISGNIKPDSRWQDVVVRLNELAGLQNWSVTGQTKSEAIIFLNAVKETGLLGLVSVERQGKKIIVSGQLDAEQRERLTSALRSWLDSHDFVLIMQNMAPMTVDESLFPSPIISIGGNKERAYLILADGQRLETGAIVKDGYEIVNIDPDLGVELFNNERLMHFPLLL